MKTKFAGIAVLFLVVAQMNVKADNGPFTVNEKLIQAFQAAFPMAEKVDWNESGDHYFVHFKDHEILSEIEYDHEGNFLASERYYKSGKMLPIHLAWALHKNSPTKPFLVLLKPIPNLKHFIILKCRIIRNGYLRAPLTVLHR